MWVRTIYIGGGTFDAGSFFCLKRHRRQFVDRWRRGTRHSAIHNGVLVESVEPGFVHDRTSTGVLAIILNILSSFRGYGLKTRLFFGRSGRPVIGCPFPLFLSCIRCFEFGPLFASVLSLKFLNKSEMVRHLHVWSKEYWRWCERGRSLLVP